MDKKVKFQQTSAKGATADAKKNQDVASTKLLPRTSRKREPASTNNVPKYEQSRKSGVQKAKSIDKRPKPKGQYHGRSTEDTKVVENASAEHGSVVAQGSKKQNLNHLLNFHYAPRDGRGGSGTWNSNYSKMVAGYSRNSNRWLPPVQRHKYNKEQFLQANCQFVVTAKGDYTAYLADPDILVDWSLIEQIRVHTTENLSCPICLYSPIAAKMTRCGHVFCWPCILHYLALSDKSWRKCPICYESIHKADLKSVVEVTSKVHNIGDVVNLRLMRRERDSLLPVPVDELDACTPNTVVPFSRNIHSQIYSKLLLGASGDIMDIIECERAQLSVELMENPQSPENCFIEQALGELMSREKQLFQQEEDKLPTSDQVSQPDDTPDLKVQEEVSKDTDEHKESTIEENSGFEKEEEEKIENSKDLPNYHLEADVEKDMDNGIDNSSDCSASNKYFYFYQVEDGQHIYLHAMNIRMLEVQYGSLENCPRTITGKLLEKEVGSFSEDLRRRLRYLRHLPVTCQFEIAEIEITPPTISEEVLDYFRDQLETRQRRRQRREREERKREKKIREEENKQMGKYPSPRVYIESDQHFPQWQPEQQSAEINIPSPSESVANSSVASSPSLSAFEEAEPALGLSQNCAVSSSNDLGPSFAQMLRNPGNASSGSTRPSARNMKSLQPSHMRIENEPTTGNEDNEAEEYVAAPSYRQSFNDALTQALEQSLILDTGAKGETKGGGKKKKRAKETVLFATSMARAS
ncbi:RING finger protein 10 [Orussus abietinus]|uniref:RING finger protein 10 n=1 Tax=Orussus abietinus TaxID=222816 RepID=UPI0006254DE7|nr:RING finger protein 10 [Orussus abietinus]